MKRFLAFVLVAVLGVLIVLSLNSNSLFVPYGETDLANRVSEEYIDRSVTEETTVIYGESIDLESGPANTVTAIVADYRSFDTLGEVTVLFVSSLGVALLLGTLSSERMKLNFKPNFMLKTGSRLLFGVILMTGVYVIAHGHLTPGGGFPGGTMIASSILLLYLSDDSFRTKVKSFKALESVAGSLYVLLGLVGLFLFDYFLVNFLDNGVLGDLFSSGIIPIVYSLIGLKVGSEISGIIDHFLTEERV
jgi:multicomponent Na+:H+ antiporter subunit B